MKTKLVCIICALVAAAFTGLAFGKKAKPVPKAAAKPQPLLSAPAVGDTSGGDYVTEKRGDTTVKYKKKTTYDFEGTGIEGLYNKPSGSYISNMKDVKGKSILRIRENFDAEVMDSTRMLR